MLEIVYRPTDALAPNDYNPNIMTDELFQFLVKQIQEKGFRQPIIIKPDDEIIDGEHRWRAAKQLGLPEVPCIIIEEEREVQMISTITMNRTRGQMHPLKFAEVIHDLHKTYTLPELESLLGYEKVELQDSLNLMKIPADLDARVRALAEEEARTLPRLISFMMLPDQVEILERALSMTDKKTRPDQLTVLAAFYIDNISQKLTDEGGPEE